MAISVFSLLPPSFPFVHFSIPLFAVVLSACFQSTLQHACGFAHSKQSASVPSHSLLHAQELFPSHDVPTYDDSSDSDVVSVEFNLQESNWATGEDVPAPSGEEERDEDVDMSDLWVSDRHPLSERKTKKVSWNRKPSRSSRKQSDGVVMSKQTSGKKLAFSGRPSVEETSFVDGPRGRPEMVVEQEMEVSQ